MEYFKKVLNIEQTNFQAEEGVDENLNGDDNNEEDDIKAEEVVEVTKMLTQGKQQVTIK